MAPANRAIYRNEVLVQRAGLLRTMQYSDSSFLLCKQSSDYDYGTASLDLSIVMD
jgi:hypothetical protein